MSLIHRYIFRSTLAASLALVLMFAFILLIGEVLRDLLGLVAEEQISFWVFGKLVFAILPYVFIHALPIGFLTGILLTMGRLSGASEIVAIRASGVSFSRLSASLICHLDGRVFRISQRQEAVGDDALAPCWTAGRVNVLKLMLHEDCY